jgi:curved DNA-binding protein CbpA
MSAQTDNRNYYEVLHVSRDAPAEIIRGSYRTLMQQLKNHPDLGGDTTTAALINEAYAVLSDADRRADYDARLDIMEHVSRGVSDADPESPATPTRKRVLDPSRQCVFCEAPHTYGSVIEVDTGCATCGSPLYTAERRRIESEGQRAVERIGKRQKVTFYTHWPQQRGFTGRIEDISLNGMRLATRHDLSEGQCIKVVSDVVEAVAQVTHRFYERRGWARHCIAGASFITLRFGRSVGGFVSNRV